MFASIFPSDVVYCKAKQWMWDTPLAAEEESHITKAIDKRKREFRAGRHCAHKAINRLLSLSDIDQPPINDQRPIKVGASRQPLWPKGVVGSISHSGGHCSTVVACSNKILSMGHDVEKARHLDASAHKMICTKKELAFIASHQPSDLPLTTLIFSAKESIHKTYWPLNHHMLDFLDAEIEIDLKSQRFTATIINPENSPKYLIRTLQGAYSMDNEYIYTGIYLRPSSSLQLAD